MERRGHAGSMEERARVQRHGDSQAGGRRANCRVEHHQLPIPLYPGINLVRIRPVDQPGAGEFVNVYYSVQSPVLPPRQGAAMFHGQPIAYEEIDGRAVYQSDGGFWARWIDVKAGNFAGRMASGGMHLRPRAVTIAPNSTFTPADYGR